MTRHDRTIAHQKPAPSCCSRLHVLTDALVVRQLQPWHANLARRYPLADRVEAIPLRALADEVPIFPTD